MNDWKNLAALRGRFLSPEGPGEDYWETPELLADYDETFAERIGWKWDSVLEEATPALPALRRLKPTIVDWGCGTGTAARRFLKVIGTEHVSGVALIDRSQIAVKFATQKIQSLKNAPPIVAAADANTPIVLLLSHVLGELRVELPSDLSQFLGKATAIFWIEPGPPAISRRLIEFRERVRDRFQILAPCPHQERCGLLAPGNETHWCHHFAAVPPIAFQSAMWNRFGKELGVDLRSLPTSYLVLIKPEAMGENFPKVDRIIGRARTYKGYLKVLVCDKSGVEDRRLLERSGKAPFKRLKKGGFSLSSQP